ncbi:MAG: SDR family NAD(P)-dependent oxidoreductase [Pseudomonadota bacterium]
MSGLAIISGGSSGIGLACARRLLSWGYSVLLIARGADGLKNARESLARSAQSDRIYCCQLDVSDQAKTQKTIAEVISAHGAPAWVVTSAGIAVPGEFLEGAGDSFRDHMAINYFGTLNLLRAAVPAMVRNGGGRLVLISSSVALSGVYGYAAYAPSKFAVRGLGEVLSVELAQHNISVTVGFPPDTDTPQLAAEMPLRPEVTRLTAKGAPTVSADSVARAVLSAAKKGKFFAGPTLPIRLLAWAQGFYGARLRHKQKSLARKSISGR